MAAIEELVSEAILEDKFVENWQDYPCLYAVNTPEFKNRDLRLQAMEEIAAKLNQTVDWVKVKLRKLRTSYTKAKKPAPSGSARKNLSKKTAWLLEKLQFLAPYVISRATVSNLDMSPSTPSTSNDLDSQEEDIDEVEEDEENCTSFSEDRGTLPITIQSDMDSPSSQSHGKCKPKSLKRKREEEEYDLIKGLARSIQKRNEPQPQESMFDEIDSFGKYIAASLRKLEPRARLMCQQGITNVLFQAQMGNQFPTVPTQPFGSFHSSTQQQQPQMYSQQQPYSYQTVTPGFQSDQI